MPFLCENIAKTFQVHYLTFHVTASFEQKIEYSIEVNYSVFKLPEEVVFTHTLGPYETPDLLMTSFLQLFWTMRECVECLAHLCPEDNRLCSDCIHHKIRDQFGIRMGYKACHEKCPICLDDVYNNRLQCGHYIHKACLIQLYPYSWYKMIDEDDFEDDIVRKMLCCPLCRSSLTVTDKQIFFALDMIPS
jgi:hypothetical protein